MLKFLLCLSTGTMIAVCLLQLRQQRLELNHQANQLHNAIESHQSKLWNQQLQIAVYTAPNAIQKTVGNQALKLSPQAPNGMTAANWLESEPTPNAN